MSNAATIIFVLLVVQPQAVGPDSITAQEVLKGYERSLEATREAIAFDFEIEVKSYDASGQPQTKIRNRDVMRVENKMSVTLKEFIKSNETSRDGQYIRSLELDNELAAYDGKSGEPPDSLQIKSIEDTTITERLSRNMGICKYLEGRAWGGLSIAEVMQHGPSLKLRDEMESINGHQTYVLEAQTEQDTYVLWLDPEYGFNPRKVEMRRVLEGEPESSESERHLLIDGVNIEKVDGKYIIMSADIRYNREDPDGGEKQRSYEYSIKRANVNYNPDFDSVIEDFWKGVPDGTPVFYQDERRFQGVKYEWVNGQVRPKVDEAFLGQLEQGIEAAKVETTARLPEQAAESTKTELQVDELGPNARIIGNNKSMASETSLHRKPLKVLMLLIGIGVIGGGLPLFINMRKRKALQ